MIVGLVGVGSSGGLGLTYDSNTFETGSFDKNVRNNFCAQPDSAAESVGFVPVSWGASEEWV